MSKGRPITDTYRGTTSFPTTMDVMKDLVSCTQASLQYNDHIKITLNLYYNGMQTVFISICLIFKQQGDIVYFLTKATVNVQ